MTLMELLVALVIGSLVITLVVRGLGLSLNLYERVGRVTASLDVEFREGSWWADSVASLIPCTDNDHCVRGNSRYFEGYTFAGIVHPPGLRVPVRWELADKDEGRSLRVVEGARSAQPAPVAMSMALPADARFSYLHPNGRWLSEWNADGDNTRLPVAIRINTGNSRTLAYGAPAQRPYGRPDYREMLGF